MTTFDQLIKAFPSKSYKKGETLLLRNDMPTSVYVIEKGSVKAYSITRDGTEHQVAIHEAGDDLPVGLSFNLTNRSEYFYQAYTNCTVRVIPIKTFQMLLRKDIEMMFRRYRQREDEYMTLLTRVDALEHSKAGDKVAFMLMYLASQINPRLRQPDKKRLSIAITQQEMADALGLTRETTGIELKKLELKQLITHSRKRYVLYVEKLRDYLEGR